MNTGIQRSGATPFGAHTTTSPAAAPGLGKAQQRKDLTAIAVAHHVPYVAQAAASYWLDLSRKAEKAARAEGPALLNVLTACPLGWGFEPKLSPQVVNAGVDSCYWPLYEVEDGMYRLSHVPDPKVPVEEWLRPQSRFAHLFQPEADGLLGEIQEQVDREWDALVARSLPPAGVSDAPLEWRKARC